MKEKDAVDLEGKKIAWLLKSNPIIKFVFHTRLFYVKDLLCRLQKVLQKLHKILEEAEARFINLWLIDNYLLYD